MAGTIDKGLIGKQDISHWDGTATKTLSRTTSSGYDLTLSCYDHIGVDICKVYGGSSLKTKAVIDLALAAVGTSDLVQFWLAPGTWTIGATLDMSAYTNITFNIPPGALLSHGANVITFGAPVKAGPYKIFSGAGQAKMAGTQRVVYAEWWDSNVAKAAASLATAPTWADDSTIGGFVRLLGKTYTVSASVVLYPGVVLEGINPAATALVAANGLNAPVVTSYNFAALTGSDLALASEDVPYLYGIKNLRIDGNKTGQVGNNNGVSFFGKQFIVDQVIIHDCSGHGWYSECGRNTTIATWQDDTLSWVGGLVTRDNTLDGFHTKGGHDMYIGHLESHGNGGYGVYNTRTLVSDGTFTFSHIHTYGNTLGNYFGHEVFGNFLESEDQLVFHVDEDPTPVGGGSGTNYEPNIAIVYVATDAAGVMLDIDRPNMNIGQLHAEVRGDLVTKAVYIQEEQVTIGGLNVEGNDHVAIGLHVEADNVNVCGGVVQHLNGVGGIGIYLGDSGVPVRRCSIDCNIMNCETAFYYADNAGFGNVVKGQYWVNTGQSLLHGSCVTPANSAERHDTFDIIADITGPPTTYLRTNCYTSEAFLVDAAAVVTVVLTHNLIWPPSLERDIQVCLQQTGGTDTWAVGFVKVTAADATTITCKVNVTTPSAVPGETARIMLWARNGGINV